MNLEPFFKPFPNLKATFWPNAEQLSHENPDNLHPLLALVLRTDKIAKNVAHRTDQCCRLIHLHNAAWLKAKADIITSECDFRNVSATLGEIRAYGELLWVWPKDVVAGNSGSDFNVTNGGRSLHIEVFTPQHRTKRYRIEHGATQRKNVTTRVVEIFPFGWPERTDKDNVQGEAVTKLAAIKKEEHQFKEEGINILWCDLKDPTLWVMGFKRNQFAPLTAFQEIITSGAFWSAFYGRKGTPVFESLAINGRGHAKIYAMEFSGRFWNQKTKLDFVIADTADGIIVFQNPNRVLAIEESVFRDIHHLFSFDLEASWLDWPCPGQLVSRVNMILDNIEKYATAFTFLE